MRKVAPTAEVGVQPQWLLNTETSRRRQSRRSDDGEPKPDVAIRHFGEGRFADEIQTIVSWIHPADPYLGGNQFLMRAGSQCGGNIICVPGHAFGRFPGYRK